MVLSDPPCGSHRRTERANRPHNPSERREKWAARLDAAEASQPSDFTNNGWVVAALQGGWSAITTTPIPQDDPAKGVFRADHLRLALEAAARRVRHRHRRSHRGRPSRRKLRLAGACAHAISSSSHPRSPARAAPTSSTSVTADTNCALSQGIPMTMVSGSGTSARCARNLKVSMESSRRAVSATPTYRPAPNRLMCD